MKETNEMVERVANMEAASKPKKELREEAQDALMHGMQTAFRSTQRSQDADIRKEMDRQMRRVEKLFGYQAGSWMRG